LVVLLLTFAPGLAATIDVGTHYLVPDLAGQQVQIYVSGGDAVAGLDLITQVSNGGGLTGADPDAPQITGADLVTGTIFESNNFFGATPQFPSDQVVSASIITDHDTVAAGGPATPALLVTLTMSTVRDQGQDPFVPGQSWPLKLKEIIQNDATKFYDGAIQEVPLSITNGLIVIRAVPEPATLAMLLGLFAAAPLLIARRRAAGRRLP
jgi:hypothetical protein